MGGVPERTKRGTLGLTLRTIKCIAAWKDSSLASAGFHFAPRRRLPDPTNSKEVEEMEDEIQNGNTTEEITDTEQQGNHEKRKELDKVNLVESEDIEERRFTTNMSVGPLCKFWRKGECRKGDMCKFRHFWTSSEEEMRNRRLRCETDRRRNEEKDDHDPFPHGKLPRTKRAKMYEHRNEIISL